MPLSYSIRLIGRDLLIISAIAFAYFAAAHGAIALLNLEFGPSPLWPSAGIALGGLVVFGIRYWPGVALGAFYVALYLGTTQWVALEAATSSTLTAIWGVIFLRHVGFQRHFHRLQDVFSLIVLGAMASCLCGAIWRTVVRCLVGSLAWEEFGNHAWTLWVGDTMGVLVVTPVLLVGSLTLKELWSGQSLKGILPHSVWELGIGLILLSGVSELVFCLKTEARWVHYPLEYLPFPFVVWAVLRYGQLGAVLSSFLVSTIAILGASQGNGPFQVHPGSQETVLFLQAFMGVLTITALVLAAAVSERQEVETRLRQNEASLANAQGIAKMGHRDFDLLTQQWRWSDQMYRLLGLTPSGLTPTEEAYLQAVHPQDRDRVQQVFEKAILTQSPQALDYRIVLPTGEERIVSEQVAIGIHSVTGTVQDITERKHYEVQLQVSAERDRLLGEMALRIRQSLDLNQILDTTVREVRQFLQADRVLISYMGAQGKIVAESVAPDRRSCLGLIFQANDYYNEIRDLFEVEGIQAIEDTTEIEIRSQARAKYLKDYQVKAVLGVPIWLSEPFLLKSGEWERSQGEDEPLPEFFGLLVAHQCDRRRKWQPFEVDLLQRLATQVAIAIQQGQLYQRLQDNQANLERQVAERTAQLQQKMQELAGSNQIKNIFLDAVSHDLRTTIMGNVILLQSQIQKGGDPISVPRCFLERMVEASNCQLGKLNGLLEATELEVNGVRLYPKPLQLQPLIEGIVEDSEALFAQNKTQLQIEVAKDLPRLMGDREQLRRVFEHLIHNAIKHNPPGVELQLGAQIFKGGECCCQAEQVIRCYVRDNGVGITPEMRDRLFDLYAPDEAAKSKRLMGIRLGLYLCRQIVTAHGGKIGVESLPGSGSTFWFTLPLVTCLSAHVSE